MVNSLLTTVTLWFDDVIMCCPHWELLCYQLTFVVSHIDIMAIHTLTHVGMLVDF